MPQLSMNQKILLRQKQFSINATLIPTLILTLIPALHSVLHCSVPLLLCLQILIQSAIVVTVVHAGSLHPFATPAERSTVGSVGSRDEWCFHVLHDGDLA